MRKLSVIFKTNDKNGKEVERKIMTSILEILEKNRCSEISVKFEDAGDIKLVPFVNGVLQGRGDGKSGKAV